MITIEVGNSYSKIKGLEAKDEKSLRSALSYVVGGESARFSTFGPRRASLLDKRGSFPTGLLDRVRKHLKGLRIETHNTLDLRTPPPLERRLALNTAFKGIIPYLDQLDAANTITRYGTGCISMPTGTGKSLVIALIIAKLQVRTLIVVPTLELKTQLTESLRSIFGKIPSIAVENIASSKLKGLKDFDLLIIDEAHHSASKTYQTLNKTAWAGIYFRAFLTATPFRNDNEETLLYEGLAGPVRYQLSYKDAIKHGYIVPIEAYYIDLPKETSNAHGWHEVYKNHVVNNFSRNVAIKTITLAAQNKGAVLCLVKEIEHGNILSEMTGIPFANGADEDTRGYIEAFNSGAIKALIGTTGIIGEGVDTKPCEYVIIAGLGKAKSAFQQQVGRAVRKYPGKESAKVIIFRDTSHKYCLRHFNAQKKILKDEYGVVPIKIEL